MSILRHSLWTSNSIKSLSINKSSLITLSLLLLKSNLLLSVLERRSGLTEPTWVCSTWWWEVYRVVLTMLIWKVSHSRNSCRWSSLWKLIKSLQILLIMLITTHSLGLEILEGLVSPLLIKRLVPKTLHLKHLLGIIHLIDFFEIFIFNDWITWWPFNRWFKMAKIWKSRLILWPLSLDLSQENFIRFCLNWA